jgi:DNA-binding MarR family transcriptional regulator
MRSTGGSGAKAEDAARIVNSLRQLFKAIQEYSKAILGRTGFSGPQVWALTVLDKEPALSLGTLSQRIFAHPSTVSGIVDRLEERGAVRRVVDEEDRRGIRLSLTPAGRRVLRGSPSPIQLGLRRALVGMPAGRLRELRRSLEEIVRETAAHQVSAPFFEVDPPRGRPGRKRRRAAKTGGRPGAGRKRG